MKANPLKDGTLIENSTGIGTVTRAMMRERAIELAVIDGRTAQEVSKVDWEQARLELTGDSSPDENAAALESAPESERWDPLPGSDGHKVPAAGSEDEDEDGRSDNERLVEEGVAAAEHDLTRAAAKADEIE
jgi:hypothetical protein